jgi:hypothetical protein
MEDPSANPSQSLVVGIDADSDPSQVMPQIGTVAGDTAPPGTPVDLVVVKRDESGISSYLLREVKPFYVRRKSKWFSIGR